MPSVYIYSIKKLYKALVRNIHGFLAKKKLKYLSHTILRHTLCLPFLRCREHTYNSGTISRDTKKKAHKLKKKRLFNVIQGKKKHTVYYFSNLVPLIKNNKILLFSH